MRMLDIWHFKKLMKGWEHGSSEKEPA
jgi:hypothetical protein